MESTTTDVTPAPLHFGDESVDAVRLGDVVTGSIAAGLRVRERATDLGCGRVQHAPGG